jgi:hypothetical protein
VDLALPFIVFGVALAAMYLTRQRRPPPVEVPLKPRAIFLAAWVLLVIALVASSVTSGVLWTVPLAGSGALLTYAGLVLAQRPGLTRVIGGGWAVAGLILLAIAVGVAVR